MPLKSLSETIGVSEKDLKYLVQKKGALILLFIIKYKSPTYAAEIEKDFLLYASRSTLIVLLKEFELRGLIRVHKDDNKKINNIFYIE